MGTSIFSNPSITFGLLPPPKSHFGKCSRRDFYIHILRCRPSPGPRLAWASDAAGWPFFLTHLCGEIALKFWQSFLEPPPKGHRPGNAWGNAGGNPWGNARTTMTQRARKAFYRKASQASKSRFPCTRNAYLRKWNCFRGPTKLAD